MKISTKYPFLIAMCCIFLFGMRVDADTPLVTLPALVSTTQINLKIDCGAAGDGQTNDTVAFQTAANLLNAAGGGTLVIPQGTYIVGQQTHVPGQYPYYKTAPVFNVQNLQGLLIEGNNAVIKVASGLRFGSFDKGTGEVYNPTVMPFVDYNYRVGDMPLVSVSNSQNIVVRNLELDGNLSNLILGGLWGDNGRQIAAYGMLFKNNNNVHVENVSSHHHALDGIAIIYPDYQAGGLPTPHYITDSQFEYNARQGFSWSGGRGIRAYRSKFNHTGRALNNGVPLMSAPGAGLDIEAELAVIREGYFEDCEFINNTGAGMVSDSGDGGYTTFKNCTFWGTTNWSAWANKPALKFEDCKFYGSVVHAVGSQDPELATRWVNCTFEDKPWNDGNVYRGNSNFYLLEINGDLKNVLFKDCRFTANTGRSIWASAHPNGRVTFDGCIITHKKADLTDRDFQALFRHADFIGCHFKEEFDAQTTKNWYIAVENAGVAAAPPSVVDGPHVKWANWSWGNVGTLPPSP